MNWESSVVSSAFGAEDDWLCSREALEWSLALPGQVLAEDREYWRRVVAHAAASPDPAAVLRRLGWVNLQDPPEGTSWLQWAEWVQERLTEAVEDPATILRGVLQEPRRYRWCLRGSVVSTEMGPVLKRLAGSRWPVLEEWGSGGRGPVRCYLTGDTGSLVGLASELDEQGRPRMSLPTTWAGVVLERCAEGARLVGVHAVAPDADPRAPSWRRRWPALHSALGGWFSEAAFGRNHPSLQQHVMLATEPDDVLARVVLEGEELLTLEDADLRSAVVALGCYVEPPHLRLWLEWMFWRIGRFEWK